MIKIKGFILALLLSIVLVGCQNNSHVADFLNTANTDNFVDTFEYLETQIFLSSNTPHYFQVIRGDDEYTIEVSEIVISESSGKNYVFYFLSATGQLLYLQDGVEINIEMFNKWDLLTVLSRIIEYLELNTYIVSFNSVVSAFVPIFNIVETRNIRNLTMPYAFQIHLTTATFLENSNLLFEFLRLRMTADEFLRFTNKFENHHQVIIRVRLCAESRQIFPIIHISVGSYMIFSIGS